MVESKEGGIVLYDRVRSAPIAVNEACLRTIGGVEKRIVKEQICYSCSDGDGGDEATDPTGACGRDCGSSPGPEEVNSGKEAGMRQNWRND